MTSEINANAHHSQREVATRKLQDRILLVGAALLVCLVGGASFLAAEVCHLNATWLFFAWNSVLMVPLLVRNFRGQYKRPAFVAFLAAWTVAHGLIVVSLMLWASYRYWIPVFAIELYAGYSAAHWLFGVLPATNGPK